VSGEAPAVHGDGNPLSGGRVNYYLVEVTDPQREDQAPYRAECEDIIQALGMSFDEGCAFKALWRTANARKGNGKAGNDAVRDMEKVVHYGGRLVRQLKRERDVAVSGKL
jgi:hypothetical protein